jgi:pyruvate kinase
VEIDIALVGVVQKRIIAQCRRQRKPVIIATQMLDSMQHSRLPTRAEVTDVSNAILDGADACMLSGETAVGEYPRETVEMMNRIALAAEPLCSHRAEEASPCSDGGQSAKTNCPTTALGLNTMTEAVVCHAGLLAEKLNAGLIIVASVSGATALSLAKNHFRVPTIGASDSAATLRRMCLYWGVIPLAGAPVDDSRSLVAFVGDWGKQNRLLSSGDRIVLIAGTKTAMTAHNMIVVHEVE